MNIFSFWDTGRANAPDIVKRCFDRWEALNPGHSLVVLSNSDLPDILNDFPFDLAELPVQPRADILRIRLLHLHGGAWADATLLPVLPLDAWREEYLKASGFFVFSASRSHWRLTNYLILAEPGNYFISELNSRIRQYWSHPRRIVDQTPGKLQPRARVGKRLFLRALTEKGLGPEFLRFYERWRKDLLYPVSDAGASGRFFPYFWEQYLMMSLVESDPRAAEIVDRMPYRLHDFCHALQNARRELGPDFLKAVPMALRAAPVQKLDWRESWPDEIFELPPPDRVLV